MRTHYLTRLPSEWEPIARIFSALGDGTRQTILLLFEPGERLGLKQIVDVLPLSRSAVVHHLNVLEQAGLLIPEKQGREVLYSVDLERAIDALDKVRVYAEDDLRTLLAQAAKDAADDAGRF